MRTYFFLILFLGLSVAFAGTVEARPEKTGATAAERFAAMDADKDGQVTREEFFAAQPHMREGAFTAIDADKNDRISLEEWQNFSAGHAKDQMGHESMQGEHMPPKHSNGTSSKPAMVMPSRSQ